jgi:hypothetical protein
MTGARSRDLSIIAETILPAAMPAEHAAKAVKIPALRLLLNRHRISKPETVRGNPPYTARISFLEALSSATIPKAASNDRGRAMAFRPIAA